VALWFDSNAKTVNISKDKDKGQGKSKGKFRPIIGHEGPECE